MTLTAPDLETQPTSQYHYHVIRRAIDLIDAGGADMSLSELANALDMSAAHFQRVFSAWAGVSPKRYQQYLRLGHAKTLLQNHHNTLNTAHSIGLSGTGRLHDLFLRWEAMSPGEYARKGAGLVIRWGWFDSPFGPALATMTPKGICGLGFGVETGHAQTEQDLFSRWPKAEFIKDVAAVQPHIHAAFSAQETRLHLIGAPLQLKVWEALLHIPAGQATTYGTIATAVQSPRAARAVGTAVGQNPISWLIPCHRVLRQGGTLGGYHWGTPVKRAMLAFEAARHEKHTTTGAVTITAR